MPAQELAFRRQVATLWERNGVDAYGRPTYATPVEVCVRWDDVYRNVRKANGDTVTVEAIITADRNVPIGSAVWLGSYEDLPGTGSASTTPEDSSHEIYAVDVTPDIKGRVYHYKWQLMRRNALRPTQR